VVAGGVDAGGRVVAMVIVVRDAGGDGRVVAIVRGGSGGRRVMVVVAVREACSEVVNTK